MPSQSWIDRLGPAARVWIGSGLALGSAMTFALNVTLVPVVYAGGGNVHAVNLVRPLFFLGCLYLWLRVAARPMRLAPARRYLSFGLGLLFCVELYALLGAIRFIPVGLALLIMYTYPMLVAVLARLLGREPMSALRVFAMLVAFYGLGLALGAPAESLDPRGVGLAAVAALALASLVVLSERTMAGVDNQVVMMHMLMATTLAVCLVTLAGFEPEWPVTGSAWAAFWASTVLYTVATFLLFTAIVMVGPLRTAVMDNSSPVWALLFGFLLLGEALSTAQVVGAVLVLEGIVFVQLTGSSEPARPA